MEENGINPESLCSGSVLSGMLARICDSIGQPLPAVIRLCEPGAP